jgi:thymidylate synthase (FAD)
MTVKIISYSQPPKNSNIPLNSAQELVAFCARVSNPSNQLNSDTSDKLINYLIEHKHWSPLEMVSLCLEINTTRDIARQILRHRSFSFQEFSQRYADPVKELNFVTRELRLQDHKNRQNSIELVNDDTVETINLVSTWEKYQRDVINLSKEAYTWAVNNGIAKEQARSVIPEGLIESRLYVNGTLRSWVHYIELRTEKGTQKEHRDIAQACANAIADVFPLIEKFKS